MPDSDTSTIPLIVDVQREKEGAIESRTFHAFAHTCFEHTPDGQRSFPTSALLDELFHVTGLHAATPGRAERFSLSAEVLEAIAKGATEENEGGPAGFQAAVQSSPTATRVTCLHTQGDRVSGGEIVWLDAGSLGLWMIEPADETRSTYVVESAPPRTIGEKILSYLP